jgi:Transposase
MAALSVASRRLPEMAQRNVLPLLLFCTGIQQSIELPNFETFPGAACCQLIELRCYKAAPLQTLRVCNLSVFPPHPSREEMIPNGLPVVDSRLFANWPRPFVNSRLELLVTSFVASLKGAVEAINGIIHLANRRGRGFRNFFYLRAIAYWVAGKLKVNLPSHLPT